jgi:hypothetical protein
MPRPLSLPNLNYSLLPGSLISSSSSLSSCWCCRRCAASIVATTIAIVFQVVVLNGFSSALWAISSYFTNAIAEVQREAQVISDIDAVLHDDRSNGFALNFELGIQEVLHAKTNASTLVVEVFLYAQIVHAKPTSVAL